MKTILKTVFLIVANSMSIKNKEDSMLIGYARVSTQDQNLALQYDALMHAGCQKIFETKAERPGLSLCLEMLREGDTLMV